MLPLTPHAQPHGYTFPALSAIQEQQAAAAAHTTPAHHSAAVAAHAASQQQQQGQHHLSDQMDFSLDQPSSLEEEQEAKQGPDVTSSSEPDMLLSPGKRRKLNGDTNGVRSHAKHAAAVTVEDASENEQDDASFFASRRLSTRRATSAVSATAQSNAHSSGVNGKRPTKSGSTPLKRKK